MPAVSLTPADFLSLLRRTTDTAWLDGLLDTSTGTAILNALFEIATTVGESVIDGCADGAISDAPGGRPAMCTVVATRADTTGSALIPKGYRFRTSQGVSLILTMDIAVAVAQGTVVLPMRTVRQSEVVNRIAVDTFSDTLEVGDLTNPIVDSTMTAILDTNLSVILGPPGVSHATRTLRYASSTPTIGAAADWLSVLGQERGVLRQPEETEGAYRTRVRNLVDSVSPKAISRAANLIAEKYKVGPVVLEEPFADGATPALKADLFLSEFSGVYLSGTLNPTVSPEEDFYSDMGVPRELVGLREARAYFRLNGNAPQSTDLQQAFFDGFSFFDDPLFGFPDASLAPAILSALMGIYNTVDTKRAGGVQFDLFIAGPIKKIGVATVTAAAFSTTFTLTPPAGRTWRYLDGHHGADTTPSGVVYDPTTMQVRLRFTFSDTSTFTTPDFVYPWGERWTLEGLQAIGFPVTKKVTEIRGEARSDGVNTINHVGQFVVLELVT
jgi:hypothetical protein